MLRLLTVLLYLLMVPAAQGQVASAALPTALSSAQGAQQPDAGLASQLSLAPSAAVRPALQDPVSFAMLGQLLMGLVVVILAILLVLWLVKRFTGLGVQGRHLKVVAALSLGAREKAVLVEVGGRQLLLGVAPGRVSLLERFESPVVETDPGAGFGARLREVLDRKESQ
ncbi:flagellar biosynthetic protein FliO [Marinobacterium rhizophilum]|uniref:Flagellar protein n=1 Tax=Marinobacterium rhizophilum TaxID=420402 RepID=A0ABY5HGA5_9GAMM|nr:flagellar biosynthetic protein FliO [Marinobacterium rhizophilum]UTW10026.1 flagellar biosynthetic protein FliO [Marinobacterium rhizophilum]